MDFFVEQNSFPSKIFRQKLKSAVIYPERYTNNYLLMMLLLTQKSTISLGQDYFKSLAIKGILEISLIEWLEHVIKKIRNCLKLWI